MANVLQTKQVDAQCDKETAGGAGDLTTNQRGYNNNRLATAYGGGWRVYNLGLLQVISNAIFRII